MFAGNLLSWGEGARLLTGMSIIFFFASNLFVLYKIFYELYYRHVPLPSGYTSVCIDCSIFVYVPYILYMGDHVKG